MEAIRSCKAHKPTFTNTHEFRPSSFLIPSIDSTQLPHPTPPSPPPPHAVSPPPEYSYINDDLLQETLEYADRVFAALSTGETEDTDVEHRYLRDHQVKIDLQYSTIQINQSLQADAELFISHQQDPCYPFPGLYAFSPLLFSDLP